MACKKNKELKMKKSELMVITKTKKLLSYIFQITEKCPVKYRYTYVSKMHNLIMEIIELMYYANGLELSNDKRREYQEKAKVKIKLLDYICEAAKDAKCIKMSQFEYITKEIYTIINLLEGWINSDNSRKETKV